ncbi:MAG: hypothetical protein ACFB5Z_02285 [Elainellaceae cyanobacterium]
MAISTLVSLSVLSHIALLPTAAIAPESLSTSLSEPAKVGALKADSAVIEAIRPKHRGSGRCGPEVCGTASYKPSRR